MAETNTGTQGQWATVREAAELLGRSERTVRRWITAGKIRVDRTGPAIRVDIARLVPVSTTTAEGMPLRGQVVGDVELLQAEIERLRESLEDARAERDRLWQALAQSQAVSLALAPERPQLTDGRPRRRWRWPWAR